MAEEFRRHQQAARQRPELHGLLFVSREAVRLPQHRAVQRAAGTDRRCVSIRRNDAVLAQKCRRTGNELFLRGIVGQRGRSRPRRLCRLSGRRSAHQTNRAVHRGYPAPGGVHARRGARARGRQADPRDQDRRHATVAIRRAVAYRRHRRRLRCVSGDVRALRHRQLPFARRSFGSGTGLSMRTAAEGSSHRLCHHVGRHRRSALRLFRI